MEAIEYAFPFDAEELPDGEYDRVYIADDFARYFRAFISSGIISDGGELSTNLQLVANSDMTTTLKAGNLIINGYRYELKNDMIFQHTAADGLLNRIDRISVTLDTAEREISAILRESEYSYSPIVPECRRTSEYRDYVVADVYVEAGAARIGQKDITDQRLNSAVCGLAVPFARIDTATIFNQFMAWFEDVKDRGETGVSEYLELLSDSGNSQLQGIVDMLQAFEAASENDFLEWFDQIRTFVESSKNGELLLRIEAIFNEMFALVTDDDIDTMIAGTYDKEETGSLFEIMSDADVDAIVEGTYELEPEETGGIPEGGQ